MLLLLLFELLDELDILGLKEEEDDEDVDDELEVELDERSKEFEEVRLVQSSFEWHLVTDVAFVELLLDELEEEEDA